MADEEAKQKEALNATLKEYISEWRKTREKEEEELKKLKEKQAKRKEIRADQDAKLNQQKKEEEEKERKEEADKRAAEAEEKKKRLEEAEAKRLEMLEAQKGGKKTVVAEDSGAHKEKTKTKEQLEEEKMTALAIRIKPIALEAMDSDELKAKANELFNIVVQLEMDKYDYEQKRIRQERDLQELKEKQKSQLKQKALKKGLDPEALVGKHPPMIRMYSKYERRTDTRTYEDRKKLYEGGWEVLRAEILDGFWKEKYSEWSKRPSKKLPKWFGERPGKKAGDPATPEGEEEGREEAAAEEEEEEEDYNDDEEEEEEE